MITGRNKNSLENHFDRNWELEAALEAKGDDGAARPGAGGRRTGRAHALHPPGRPARPRPRGALRRAARRRRAVRGAARRRPDRPARPAAADRCSTSAQRYGGSVVALMEVPKEQVHLYGCAAVESAGRRLRRRPHHRPGREAAGRGGAQQPRHHRPLRPGPGVFDVLRRPSPAAAARSSSPTRCARWPRPASTARCTAWSSRGRRYDTGDRLDYLKAVVRLACERDDLGPDFSRLAARASWRPRSCGR